MLNFQQMLGLSPAADAFPMTETASGGIWYITVEPPAGPNWYGYNFTVDGAHVADPHNRNLWSGSATSFSAVGQWSIVLLEIRQKSSSLDQEYLGHFNERLAGYRQSIYRTTDAVQAATNQFQAAQRKQLDVDTIRAQVVATIVASVLAAGSASRGTTGTRGTRSVGPSGALGRVARAAEDGSVGRVERSAA